MDAPQNQFPNPDEKKPSGEGEAPPTSTVTTGAVSSIGRILPLNYPVSYYPSVSAALATQIITTTLPSQSIISTLSDQVAGASPQVMVHQREYYVYNDEHIGEMDSLRRRVEVADAEFLRFRDVIGRLEYDNERLRVEKDGLVQQLHFYEKEGNDYRRIRADMATLLREREEVMAQVAKLEDRWAEEVQYLRHENQALKRELNVVQYREVREVDTKGKIQRAEEEMRALDKEVLRLTALLKERDEEILKLKQLEGKEGALTKCETDRSRLEELLKIERTERLHCEEVISALREELAALREELAALHASRAAHATSSPRDVAPFKPTMRPILGVDVKMLDDGIGGKDNVVVVHAVTPEGPAEQAGIRAEDILQLYNGQLLDSRAKFQQLTAESEIGSTVTMDVWRAGKVQKVELVVAGAPVTHKQKKYKAKSKNVAAAEDKL